MNFRESEIDDIKVDWSISGTHLRIPARWKQSLWSKTHCKMYPKTIDFESAIFF